MHTVIVGNGFIGANIASKLNCRDKITVVSDYGKRSEDESIEYQSYEEAFQKFNSLNFRSEEPLCLINASGRINHGSSKTNKARLEYEHVTRPLRLLSCIKWKPFDQFIQLGTSEENILEEFGPKHALVSPYAEAKALFWQKLLELESQKRPQVCINLKLFLIFGHGQANDRFLPFVIQSCLMGQTFHLSDCQQIRDFLHVADLVDLIDAIQVSTLQGCKSMDVGSGAGTRLIDLVQAVQAICKKGQPMFGTRSKIGIRQELPELIADLKEAQQLFGWYPKKNVFDELRNLIKLDV